MEMERKWRFRGWKGKGMGSEVMSGVGKGMEKAVCKDLLRDFANIYIFLWVR